MNGFESESPVTYTQINEFGVSSPSFAGLKRKCTGDNRVEEATKVAGFPLYQADLSEGSSREILKDARLVDIQDKFSPRFFNLDDKLARRKAKLEKLEELKTSVGEADFGKRVSSVLHNRLLATLDLETFCDKALLPTLTDSNGASFQLLGDNFLHDYYDNGLSLFIQLTNAEIAHFKAVRVKLAAELTAATEALYFEDNSLFPSTSDVEEFYKTITSKRSENLSKKEKELAAKSKPSDAEAGSTDALDALITQSIHSDAVMEIDQGGDANVPSAQQLQQQQEPAARSANSEPSSVKSLPSGADLLPGLSAAALQEMFSSFASNLRKELKEELLAQIVPPQKKSQPFKASLLGKGGANAARGPGQPQQRPSSRVPNEQQQSGDRGLGHGGGKPAHAFGNKQQPQQPRSGSKPHQPPHHQHHHNRRQSYPNQTLPGKGAGKGTENA